MTITHYTIQANREKPLRLGFISDLHDTENAPILAALEAEQVDAVLGGGDYIHNNTVYQRGLEFLSLAARRWPLFCALGNHEKRFKGDIRGEIRKTGTVLLDNSFTVFEGLVLGGLTSGWYKRMDFWEETPPPETPWLTAFEQQEGFKILLNHHPEYYEPYLRERSVDLILSGHAHGGQWRFFGRGVLAPGQGFFPKYTGGIHEERFIISRGLGNFHAIPRIFNKPELVILDLQ